MENFSFELWEDDENSLEEGIFASEEEVEREIKAAKDSPTYENADELFRVISRDEAFEALLQDKPKTKTNV
jgi:hypothetical protein